MENKYYIYQHLNSSGNKVEYVGYGFGDRAWSITNRDKEYREYLLSRISNGEIPEDWVSIGHRGLSKEDAQTLEKKLIEELRPRFNRNDKYRGLKFSINDLKKAQILRRLNYSYSRIAKDLGFSTMTVYRAMTGQTRAHT